MKLMFWLNEMCARDVCVSAGAKSGSDIRSDIQWIN